MSCDGVSIGDNSLKEERISFGAFSEDKERSFGVVLLECVENFGGLDWIGSVIERESEKLLSSFDPSGFGLTKVLGRDGCLFWKDKECNGQ